ncbi:DUF5615 family PIN-like protein [Solwaraspora sp. WMMD1047]|uniref:DUF5615 family PIN-like protein n=1 Tax=Solwaraspora sp. WMMD1047 TaxID=3016102 RepID=UPI00241659B5|nr:DUF5615 family PIN-like protein [Solwaraspora sp. WMMD1047]MDG4829352.1 DUF5615 family PIN-like protein [Solwaraspora sp. WMMD1047]
MLDEMFSPAIAVALRDRGHTVISVAERLDLRTMTDHEVFALAAAERAWLLTENVQDFRPILLQALQAGAATPCLLFTSSRTVPRSRKQIGTLIDALDAWLVTGPPSPPITEDWLSNPDPGSPAR